MNVTQENGITFVDASFDELGDVAAAVIAAHPVKHLRDKVRGVAGTAFRCKGCAYYFESTGRDESARRAADYAWARHVEAVRG